MIKYRVTEKKYSKQNVRHPVTGEELPGVPVSAILKRELPSMYEGRLAVEYEAKYAFPTLKGKQLSKFKKDVGKKLFVLGNKHTNYIQDQGITTQVVHLPVTVVEKPEKGVPYVRLTVRSYLSTVRNMKHLNEQQWKKVFDKLGNYHKNARSTIEKLVEKKIINKKRKYY